ncbi:GNAT family N-acetyltransferase [Bacillus sp. FJAT-42376]|uniref:GNAT family N-acetyltransferase n=1 Tax=Bacillus sp. FJAT-42376 TaxID=2014076 RepID=UPI000F4DDD02|nr:GNAT family N-acetyltransferase [Bacillus sp. FJAT-42376]AZB42175.1 GNAT family N-acetyltransferase [Bacillus sp. FJAT-42376]
MMNLQEALTLDFAYLETFTTRKDTPWGSLFLNENEPNYYDANHAHISGECSNPADVADEVIRFYQSRNIIPRFYLYQLQKQQSFITELQTRGFQYEELTNPVQIWTGQVETVPSQNVTIEKVNLENFHEALQIQCSIKEFGGTNVIEKIFKKQFNHPSFTHYLLRYDGEACAAACIFEEGKQARIESVATLQAYRGKGLIGELLAFIQKEAMRKNIEKLWVFPINERVEKVYSRYGFKTIASMKTGHAFLGGKSIKEIQS